MAVNFKKVPNIQLPSGAQSRRRSQRSIPVVSGQSDDAYVYIRYATDSSGSNLSSTPTASHTYIAIKSTTEPLADVSASAFSGMWFNWKGQPGDAVNTIITGSTNPLAGIGNNGDFYLQTQLGLPFKFYGPKASGTWPAGVELAGKQGDPGPAGTPGTPGANGTAGINGATIHYGNGAPSNSLGNDGDSYLDQTAKEFYAKKTGGVWGTGFDMVGPPGSGSGGTILSGSGAPTSGVGANGDSYFDTTNKVFYAPKTAGAWPAGTSLIGQQGIQGIQGNSGLPGANGNTILYGNGDPTGAVGANGDSYVDLTANVFYAKKTSGAWPAGVPIRGPQGDSGGPVYKIWAGATRVNPNAGWVAFNSATYSAGTMTQMYINSTTLRGQNILGIIATMDADDTLLFLPATTASGALYLSVNSVTAEEGGVWYTIDITYRAGSLTNDSEYSINYSKGSVGGGGGGATQTGTHAQMRALPIASWTREQYLVSNYGVRGAGIMYRSNGTEAVVDGDGQLYSDHPMRKIIFPNSQPTAIASNATAIVANNGKVQITSVAHSLTADTASSLVEPCSIYISAWSGTGATAGFYKILAVDDVDNYTIDLAYNANFGVPTVAPKLKALSTQINIVVPPLNNYSEIIVTLLAEYTPGTAIKQIIAELNGVQFAVAVQDSEDQVTAIKRFGFRNVGAKNKQESLFIGDNDSIKPRSLLPIQKTAIDTTAETTITLKVFSDNANEYVCIRHVEAIIRY